MISVKRKHFVQCHAKMRARDIGWRPVVLRWRTRGKQLTNVIVRRVETSTRVLSFPQFHFHFSNQQTYRSSTNISRGAISSTRVFPTRIIREEPRATLSARSSVGQMVHYQRNIAADFRNTSSPEHRDFKVLQVSALNPASARVVASQPLTPRKYRFSQPDIRVRRQRASKEGPEFPFKSQPGILRRRLPPVAARSRKINNATEERRESKPLPPQYSRIEELVWRRVSKTTTDINELVRQQKVIESPEPLSSHPVVNQQTQVHASQAKETVSTGPITRLDPALMDRLANDVIRRMEKRVRIERERRGL